METLPIFYGPLDEPDRRQEYVPIDGDHPNTEEALKETRGHLHLYHSCQFSKSWCRCGPFRTLRLKRRRRPRRVLYCKDLDQEFWFNWLRYFCKAPRRILYLVCHKVPGKVGLLRGLQNLRQPERATEDGTIEAVEAGCIPWQDSGREPTTTSLNEETADSDQGTSAGDAGSSESIPGSNYRPSSQLSKKMNEFQRLVTTIKEFLVVPIHSTCEVDDWVRNPKLRYFNKGDNDYKRAVDCIQREYMLLDRKGIVEIVSRAPKPLWYARHSEHYYEIDYSVNLLERLLLFQYTDEDGVAEFLERLNNICEKKLPKLNTMYLWGPANCGKSYFARCVTAFYLNVGSVENFVRGEAFPLNDAVAKRILLWEEPSIAPSCLEEVKLLCGGDPMPVKVKYQGNSVVVRTPLIVTANHVAIPAHDPAFRARVYFENWREYSKLQKENKYPHPMAYNFLLNKYNID